ncbi:MAG: hypothetical protein EAZ57_04745 [Cytophagales bacterium]|nr:MAG: hypothetical protein EAZ67_01135 [Cytophagales bacterium]TAF61101.1 MAG: hypothetical protein EAZ57_04745 [Cytophagales bacterium]
MLWFWLLLQIGLLGAAFCACVFWWFSEQRKLLTLALAIKLLAGLALGLFYARTGGGDSTNLFGSACQLASLFWQNPQAYWQVLLAASPKAYPEWTSSLSQHDPRAFFFIKYLSFWAIFTAQSYYLTSLWQSFFAFLGLYQTARCVMCFLNSRSKSWYLAFLYTPSIVFWVSGVSKESLYWACMGGLAYVARQSSKGNLKFWHMLFIAGCFWLLWQTKYHLAAFLALGAMIQLFVRYLNKLRPLKHKEALVLVTLCWLGAVFGSQMLLRQLSLEQLLYTLDRNREVMLAKSDLAEVSLLYFDRFSPLWFWEAFQLLWASFFAPACWQAQNMIQFVAGLEQTAALAFLVWIFPWPSSKHDFWPKKTALEWSFGLSMLFFVLLLAFLTGLATPNWGTLVRYKAAYWPFCIGILYSYWSYQSRTKPA